MKILKVLENKFKSGNDVPVSRATITREEYEEFLEEYKDILLPVLLRLKDK